MYFDVMFVRGQPLSVSISRALKVRTAEVLANRKAETLLGSLKRIKAAYARRGFIAKRTAADNEFRTLESALSTEGMMLDTASSDEYVLEVERHIRTINEKCRAIFNMLLSRKGCQIL